MGVSNHFVWASRSLALFLTVACTAPSAGPPEPVVEQTQVEQTALEYFESKRNWQCEPGKEHWRLQGTPKRGGTFTRANTNLTHLDPSAPGGNSHYAPQAYEHLVETRACYYEDTVMVPGLAKSWDISPDGLTWTLKLRDDARWAKKAPLNGRPFTSEDVAWTIEHQREGGMLRSSWANVTYGTPDPLTIVLKLKETDADFLGNVLGERNQYMLPREIKEQYGDFKQMAIGTGPYLLKTYTPNQRVVMERNPDYRETGFDGKPLPYIDEIDMPVIADYSAEVAAMRAGQLDLNSVTGYLKRDADALNAAGIKLKMYQDVAPIPRGLYMNLNHKPFDDIRVRRALMYAIDHEEIIEGGYQGGAMRTGHMPSSIMEYAWPPTKAREKFKPDRDRAKQLLLEAGFQPGALTFVMKTGSTPQDLAGAEVTQNHLKLIGVEANIEQVTGFVASTIARRDYVVAWGGVSPASIFPDRWMGGFLRCGDSRNVTNLCDPEIDRLSRSQGAELDRARRKALLDQLQERLYDHHMPYVPTLSLIYYRFYNCRVKNMPSTEYTQQVSGIARAWLDPAGC